MTSHIVSSRAALALAAALLLAGCASTPARQRPQAATPRPALSPPPLTPTSRGDLVVGRTAPMLVASFGPPALDIREGTARKLQFLNGTCVLDAYLYPPPGRSGEPVVTHVDARLPDGRDTDRASCAAALRRR